MLALEERVEADLALGEHAPVAGELEALVAEHPLRERLRGQQMLALYRLGRHAEALATYRDFRDAPRRRARPRARPGAARRSSRRSSPTSSPAARQRAARPADADVRARGRPARASRRCCSAPTCACSRSPVPAASARRGWRSRSRARRDARFVSLASVARRRAGRARDLRRARRHAASPASRAEDALHRALGRASTPPVVLDNLEHLPGAAAVVGRLLEHAPAAHRARHEPPAARAAAPSIATRSAPLAEAAAVRLFETRARARGFALAATDAPRSRTSAAASAASAGDRARRRAARRARSRRPRRAPRRRARAARPRPGATRPHASARCAPRSTGATSC